MINFRAITEDNFDAIIRMKRPDDEHFVASNAYSLAQAWLYRDAGDVYPFAIYDDETPVIDSEGVDVAGVADVYPFAIYDDETPVGFMMLDEDLDEKCVIIWRIMFPVENQNKGYGTAAIREIIRLAKESGKYDFVLIDYAPDNKIAEHVYTKLGFKHTGVFEHGEYELRLDL